MSELRAGHAHFRGMNLLWSAVTVVAVMSFSMAGCFMPVPTADAPCPCAAGFRCCEAANVCRVPGEACPDVPGSGGGPGRDGGAFPVTLGPLPVTSDGAGPAMRFGAQLKSLASPFVSTSAAFTTWSSSVYVAALWSADCTDRQTSWRQLTLSRFDVQGASLEPVWTIPLGSPGQSSALGAVATADGVFVAGSTYGAFPGESYHGQGDAFVARVSHEGQVAWVRELGTIDTDELAALSPAPDGGVFAAGSTSGVLEPGHVSSGGGELFVARLELDGTISWVRQHGPATRVEDLTAWDGAPLIASWSLSGSSVELMLRSLDADGRELFATKPPITSEGTASLFGGDAVARVHGLAADGAGHFSLVEQLVGHDGGVEPVRSLGSWPAANDELYAFTLGHRDDGVWYAAGAAPGGRVLTVTRQGVDGGREASQRWLFDGPTIGWAVGSASFVTPLGLAVLANGTVVLLGEYPSTECSNDHLLFLMGF